MEFQSFLIKYAEIGIKGRNRYLFEDKLVSRISEALKRVEGRFAVSKTSGRIYVEAQTPYDYEDTVAALQHVFGIAGICPLVQVADEGFDKLAQDVIDYVGQMYPDRHFSFKVDTRRARKDYPLTSGEISAALGEKLLDAYPELHVDVHQPDVFVNIEIRSKINIYSLILPGPGGMPVGTGGRAMLLLSGGIDSPVAGYMVAKRGVIVDAVYFHAPPYTSERAKQKVVDLARIISAYTGPIRLHVVNFTEIQLAIYETCPHEELTIIMRRWMMRIAQKIGEADGCQALVTGESIGQVASQTVLSLAATNEVCEVPVFRPLIAFDKQEIVELAKKIGTFETSILPFEDCCTIFVAKHPVTKPNRNIIRRSESRLEPGIEAMAEAAVSGAELITVGPDSETV
mgnify:CR=1 FL=1